MTRRSATAGSGGFTLLEVMISLTIAVVLLLGFESLVSTGRKASTSSNAWMDVDEKLQRLERKIVEELKWASIVGEDINGNLVLDTGEDRNGNARLDSDWSVTADSITFNRVLADGRLTLPITYRMVGSELERVVMTNTAGNRSRVVVARNLLAFAAARSGNSVALTLRFREPVRGGETVERQRTFTVRPRN